MGDERAPANVLAVANGKGGVGKTSLSANLAAVAAMGGWRVLLVDLDPQGNLAADLGVVGESNDRGAAVCGTVTRGRALRPVEKARYYPDNGGQIDICPGGHRLDGLEEVLFAARRTGQPLTHLRESLAETAGQYNLVMIDCPPRTGGVIMEAVLVGSRFVVVPTRFDDRSIDGLTKVGVDFAEVRANGSNPDLELLGVVLFDFDAGATKILSDTRAQIDRLLDGAAPVFPTFIRHAVASAKGSRESALLAAELEAESKTAAPWYSKLKKSEPVWEKGPRFGANIVDLANDYQQLATEVFGRFLARSGATRDAGR